MLSRILNNEFQGFYTNDFIEQNQDKIINGQLASEWQLTELLPNPQLQNPIWNGTEWIEGLTPEEISEQTARQKKETETQLYIKRTNDGINAYAEISAEFRLAKLSGTITEETHAHIERVLIPVRNEVLAGQWISGLRELELIGREAIGQQLYDRLHLQMSNYINENYKE